MISIQLNHIVVTSCVSTHVLKWWVSRAPHWDSEHMSVCSPKPDMMHARNRCGETTSNSKILRICLAKCVLLHCRVVFSTKEYWTCLFGAAVWADVITIIIIILIAINILIMNFIIIQLLGIGQMMMMMILINIYIVSLQFNGTVLCPVILKFSWSWIIK